MNDKTIFTRLNEHLLSAVESQQRDWFVIALQGSQNYGLADETSDIDSKMLMLPSFKEIALGVNPCSTTHIMNNDEHVDCKDVRTYFHILRKMNINFSEILYTDWAIPNERFADLWYELCRHRESIVRANEFRFMKCCKGMIHEKAHALDHRYPSRAMFIDKYGYDGKQLSHILRVFDFAKRYAEGEDYKSCLTPTNLKYLLCVKRHMADINYAEACAMRDLFVNKIDTLEKQYNSKRQNVFDKNVDSLLNDILYELFVKKMKEELM